VLCCCAAVSASVVSVLHFNDKDDGDDDAHCAMHCSMVTARCVMLCVDSDAALSFSAERQMELHGRDAVDAVQMEIATKKRTRKYEGN